MNFIENQRKFKPESFWNSINLLLAKPHVVNKRLWGCKLHFKIHYNLNGSSWNLPDTCRRLKEGIRTDNIEDQTKYVKNEIGISSLLESESAAESDIILVLLELLPKCYTANPAYQLVCQDKQHNLVQFYDITPEMYNQNLCPNFTYCFQLEDDNIKLITDCDENSKSYLWIRNTLLPQIVKWGTEIIGTKTNLCNESLALVVKDSYYEKYNYLKIKYGKEMVKIWPECTDPSKFVYEDVAIAAYLLLLWQNNDSHVSKKSFVDLGCGNGLLVYILTEEGHVGIGLDVRKRNIWDMYPASVKLEEKTIEPSDVSLFPDTDWIIGNHSDELTPWIPVIAARSSYKCNFFLLPCCAYNFDGTKYQRKNSSKSQYTEYLEHIKDLSEKCGFKVDSDRLKIPSTKRICLVGRGRTYSEDFQNQHTSQIQELINKDSDAKQDTQLWVNDFKAREPVERVRNCTQLDRSLIDSIVQTISNYLLEGSTTQTEWSIGKSIDINELVQLIPQDQLKLLKSECGGLQTLLKNNHHIFKVVSGKVQLRYPKTVEEVTQNTNMKKKQNSTPIQVQKKLCWFHMNHPQGCPLSDVTCSYLHVR